MLIRSSTMNVDQTLSIKFVSADELSDLRRKALRNNDARSHVRDPRDHEAGSLHLGGYLGHQLVACASFYEGAAPFSTHLTSWHMRFVGVHPSFQRQGHGSVLLHSAEGHLRELEVEQIWANARDSALGFYQNLGWSEIPGSQHHSPPPLNLPHTVIYKVINPRGRQS